MTRILRCYDYIDQPYPSVREVMRGDPHHVFRAATARAAEHAASIHARIAGLDVGKDVLIRIADIAESRTSFGAPTTRLTLEWTAASAPSMFPTMIATLSLVPLSDRDTQLELEGRYFLPLGRLGEVIDAVLGHRIAEASVSQFVKEVATWLRHALARSSFIQL